MIQNVFFSRTRYYLTWLHKGFPLDCWIYESDSGSVTVIFSSAIFHLEDIYHNCWYLKIVQQEAICLKVKLTKDKILFYWYFGLFPEIIFEVQNHIFLYFEKVSGKWRKQIIDLSLSLPFNMFLLVLLFTIKVLA